jgi:hypothetical protein
MGYAPPLPKKHKSRLERLVRDKHSYLFHPFVTYYGKRAIAIKFLIFIINNIFE